MTTPTLAAPQQTFMLVARAQAGDRDAFAQLYKDHAAMVFRYIKRRTGGTGDPAEDLTSDTFLHALRRIDTFNWQGRDFGAWLTVIARNVVNDHFKSARVRLEETLGAWPDLWSGEDDPEQPVINAAVHHELVQALQRLPARMGEIAWHYACGRTTGDIATELSIASSTVRVQLHQARLRLRNDTHVQALLH